MGKKETVTTSGSGILTILLIVFIVLKCTGLIDWSWWWVLAPLWIPAVLVFFYLIVVFTIAIIRENKDRIFK